MKEVFTDPILIGMLVFIFFAWMVYVESRFKRARAFDKLIVVILHDNGLVSEEIRKMICEEE